MFLEQLQDILPSGIKYFIKPYFRRFFPNKIFALWWVTFKCTYRCSYCPYCGIQDYSEHFNDLEIKDEDWIKILEKLPPTSFYFAGGEPMLYKSLPYIINNLPKKHSVMGMISNASLPVDVYKKIKKKIHLNLSFHREFTNEEEFIGKVLELKKMFNVAVNIVATPENIPFLAKCKEICDKNKIVLHVDPFVTNGNEVYEYNEEQKKALKGLISHDRNDKKKRILASKSKKICSAGKNYYNIMPDGSVSICSNAMDMKYSKFRTEQLSDNFFLGNILDENFKLKSSKIECSHKCLNHCDIDCCQIDVMK